MTTREQPCSALRGDGLEIQLFADRVIVRNTGISALLFGKDERTIRFNQIDDVFLYDHIEQNESMLKLALKDAELPIIVTYHHKQESEAKAIRDFLDLNVHHEGVRAGLSSMGL